MAGSGILHRVFPYFSGDSFSSLSPILNSRMEFESFPFPSAGRELHQAVVAARNVLTATEEEHQRLFHAGSPGRRLAGLAYASAVHQYSSAVMAWLVWLDRFGDATWQTGEGAQSAAKG